MVSRESVNYVKEHLGLGFSEEEIKLELIKHGHSVVDIEEAISAVKKKGVQGKPKKNLTTALVILTIVVAVALVVFFVLVKVKMPDIPLERSEAVIAPISPEAAPDVLPEKVPPYIPSEISEPVHPVAAPSEAEPTQVVVPSEPVEPAHVGREIPEYDISGLSFNLTPRLEVIKGISLQNPDAAVRMCADYNTYAERDACFAMIAKSIPDNKLCGRITEQVLRDQCFLSFAVTGTDTCSKINDTVVKEACDKLVELNLSSRIP